MSKNDSQHLQRVTHLTPKITTNTTALAPDPEALRLDQTRSSMSIASTMSICLALSRIYTTDSPPKRSHLSLSVSNVHGSYDCLWLSQNRGRAGPGPELGQPLGRGLQDQSNQSRTPKPIEDSNLDNTNQAWPESHRGLSKLGSDTRRPAPTGDRLSTNDSCRPGTGWSACGIRSE